MTNFTHEAGAVRAIRVTLDDRPLAFKGRDAWALDQLITAGEQGCTPLTNVGPRWSGYVHKLRKAGLVVETIHESHKGPYAGRHARYVLRSPVTIIEREAA